jgi:class 3 adenylate cyclase
MASLISTSLYDYEEGMMYYQKYLALRDSLETIKGISKQELAQQEYSVERTEKELAQILFERELQGLELKNLRIEGEKKAQELELLRKTTELQNATIKNQELEKNRALQDLLLAEERLAAEKKDREIQDLKIQQQLQESELKRSELEQIRQQQEIEVLTITKERNELTIQKQRSRNAFLAGIALLAIIILVLVIRWLRFAKRTNRVLSEQRNKIQQQKEAIENQYEIIKVEQEKSDRLLLNILPEHTANELKEKGRAAPKEYKMVTVLFTDFVGFTKVAEKLTPEELINELDLCFMEFDRIIGNHNLEKIKTIGDAYMCAGGIPIENDSNPWDAVEAALEIRDFMDKTREERRNNGFDYWELRIGMHTGEIVAGVVGKKKFAYDIWGDAVNTASRMESSGEAGKVNISGSTYELIKEQYKCTYRGKVYAKNKGEIDMYFVEGQG